MSSVDVIVLLLSLRPFSAAVRCKSALDQPQVQVRVLILDDASPDNTLRLAPH